MPLPHRPLVQFLGMKPKKEYLIWREKNGFFAAMDRSGEIFLWSMPGGDLIDTKQLNLNLSQYEIFESHPADDTYKRNYQDRIDRTVQLLKSKVKSKLKYNRSASMVKAVDTMTMTRDGERHMYILRMIEMQHHQDPNTDSFEDREDTVLHGTVGVQETCWFTFDLEVYHKEH